MTELSFEFWQTLADQMLLTSSLLCGFSITVIASLLVSENNSKLFKRIMVAATCAASFLLVTVFAASKILVMTSKGYPFKVVNSDLFIPRLAVVISFYLGIISLITVISLAGWTKSKKMGRFTTAIGIITLILLLMMAG